jgi:hypothetical protein
LSGVEIIEIKRLLPDEEMFISRGTGECFALKYLAPYIFCVAISNQRTVRVIDTHVSFRYQSTKTGKTKTYTLSAEEFIRRFLQHVLPKGFVKVRYYGFFSSGLRARLTQLQARLDRAQPQLNTHNTERQPQTSEQSDHMLCPVCGQIMRKLKRIPILSDKPP